MDALTLLQEAHAAGLQVRVDGGKLVVRGPRSAEPLAKQLLAHKSAILPLVSPPAQPLHTRLDHYGEPACCGVCGTAPAPYRSPDGADFCEVHSWAADVDWSGMFQPDTCADCGSTELAQYVPSGAAYCEAHKKPLGFCAECMTKVVLRPDGPGRMTPDCGHGYFPWPEEGGTDEQGGSR